MATEDEVVEDAAEGAAQAEGITPTLYQCHTWRSSLLEHLNIYFYLFFIKFVVIDDKVETFDKADTREVGLIVRELIVHLHVHGEIEIKSIFLSIYSRYVDYNSTTSGCQNTKL